MRTRGYENLKHVFIQTLGHITLIMKRFTLFRGGCENWFETRGWNKTIFPVLLNPWKSTKFVRAELQDLICFNSLSSRRSWRDFARECFCCGSEAVRGLVKSRVEYPRGLRQGENMAAPPLARSRIPPATQAIAYPN